MEIVDPLQHPDWDTWVSRFPEAQFFHGRRWAQALSETYGHQPVYPCQGFGAGMEGMMPLMEVRSAFTGLRGVSLPFTDFCNSLGSGKTNRKALFEAAVAEGGRRGWRYFECRNGNDGGPEAAPSLSFWGHEIDLTVGTGRLMKGISAAGQRAVRKAERARLKVEFRTDLAAMESYFEMHCQTRRRHGLPPQPFRFFQNIQQILLSAGQGEIGLVFLNEAPIAGAVYVWHGRRAMYKFGASDSDSRADRPNNLLMWRAMERYEGKGLETLHLGRTSLFHDGLRRFKLGFGAKEEKINFCKFDYKRRGFVSEADQVEGWFNRIFANLPLFMSRLAGKMLYPHLS